MAGAGAAGGCEWEQQVSQDLEQQQVVVSNEGGVAHVRQEGAEEEQDIGNAVVQQAGDEARLREERGGQAYKPWVTVRKSLR